MLILRYGFQIMCWLSRPILLLMTATMPGTEPTGPPKCRSAEWSMDWACSLETNLLRAVITNVWITSRDLFDCRLAWWNTIESGVVRRAHFKWLRSQGKVRLTALLQEWFNSMKCSSICVVVKNMLHDIKINLSIVFNNIWDTWTHNLIYEVQCTY